jgi:hypothetical protein
MVSLSNHHRKNDFEPPFDGSVSSPQAELRVTFPFYIRQIENCRRPAFRLIDRTARGTMTFKRTDEFVAAAIGIRC